MQVTKFHSLEADTLCVYRSSNGNSVELLNNIVSMITPGKSTLITGDFNICMLNHWKNRMTKGLESIGFIQMIKEPTHILGGHIDHIYWRDETSWWEDLEVQLYTPYYSDHDALLISMTRKD